MTKSNENRFEIIAGPSREDLFDGLRLRHESRLVLFSILSGHHSNALYNKSLQLQVNGIAVEDGSGHKWLIELHDPTKTFGSSKLHGYFDTNTRKGWVEPILK